MTTTRVVNISCQTCGLTSIVPVDALLVSVAVEEEDAAAGIIAWTCDSCGDLVTAQVDWRALLTLVTAGATLLDDASDSDGEALPPHPEHPAEGTPLSRDDLLALHELLASDSWFDQLTSAGSVNP